MEHFSLRLLLVALAAMTVFAMPAAALVCGDSEPDAGEQCDDGNTTSGDGCSATCTLEPGFSCTDAIAGDLVPIPPIPPVPSMCLAVRPTDIFEFSVYMMSTETGSPSLRDTVIGLGPDTFIPGLDITFSNDLDVNNFGTMTWSLTNNTGFDLTNLSLFGFLDAEIDEVINTFFNEFGTTSDLVLGGGSGDGLADSFEIDEPGFVFGDIIANLLAGSLDNTNAIQPALADDVSLALGFDVNTLLAGQVLTATFDISFLNNNGLGHVDPNSNFQFWYNGAIELSVTDADGDGVPDDNDFCPATAMGDAVDVNGCSDTQVDGDGDGVCDVGALSAGPSACNGSDLCATTAMGDAVDANGCSDAQVDDDGDGVCTAGAPSNGPSGCVGVDVCAGTEIPEQTVPMVTLKKNRYALTGIPSNTIFESSNNTVFTTMDTGGCSCEQIIDGLGLGGGHVKFGCSKSAMQQWIDQL